MSDKINDDLTIDIECPLCLKLLPRRGVKGNIFGVHQFVCMWCEETFEITIDLPESDT